MRIKLLASFFALALLPVIGFSQPDKEELLDALKDATYSQKFRAANDLFYEKQYNLALPIWVNIVENDSTNDHANFKAGVCYLKSNTERTKALPYLERTKDNISSKWFPYDESETRAPMEAYYYLAKAYHLDYQFDKAMKYYQKFKEEAHRKHMLQDEADHDIAQCKVGQKLVANPRDWEIRNIGPQINSEYSDYSPVLSIDGRIMFFTSRRVRKDSSNIDEINPNDGKHYEDIYATYKGRDGKWSEPKVLNFSYPNRNEATIGVSADGTQLFVYIDDDGDGNIYYAEQVDTAFGNLRYVTEANSDAWETHASVSPDGNTMYFVSDRKGGVGGRDIYQLNKLPNGRWGKAFPVPGPINSKYDEDAPYISADGQKMYFSSNNRNSMGGFDIFVSEKKEDGMWGEPKNMGYPLNTVDDDIFFMTSANGKIGYYSSLHQMFSEEHGVDHGYGEKDIYTISFDTAAVSRLAILKGYIIPDEGEPIPSNVEIWVTDLTAATEPKPYKPNQIDGGYVLTLTPCHKYYIEYLIDGEQFHEANIDVPCHSDYQEIHKEIYLNPVMADTDGTTKYKMVRWKVIRSAEDITGTQVAYFDHEGHEIGEVTINENGVFQYKKLMSQDSYIFELKDLDPNLCKEACIALIDSNEQIIGIAKWDERCRFKYADIDKHWQLVTKDGKPYNGEKLKVTFLDKDGNITFEETISCNGLFKYRSLKGQDQFLMELSSDEPGLCDELKIVLLDENNNKVGETIRDARCKFIYKRDAGTLPPDTTDIAQDTTTDVEPDIEIEKDTTSTTTEVEVDVEPANYERFYRYNETGKLAEQRFNAFINKAAAIAEKRGYVKIDVQSSASKVPTSTYGTNSRLSKARAESAKQKVLKALNAKGIESKDIRFVSIDALVLGPDYKDDFMENKDTYEKYQYVKIKAY